MRSLGTPPATPSETEAIFNAPNEGWAAWFLLEYTSLINRYIYYYYELDDSTRDLICASLDRDVQPSFSGLSAPVAKTVSILLPMLRKLARNVVRSKVDIGKNLREYLPSLLQLLREPGLPGWIAYKSGSLAFLAQLRGRPGRVEGEARELEKLSRYLSIHEELKQVWDCMCEMSGRSEKDTLRRIRGSAAFYDALPLRVRTEDGLLLSLAELVFQHHVEKKPYPYGWLQRVDIPRDEVLRVIELHLDRFTETVSVIPSMRSFWPMTIEPRIPASIRDRLLEVARKSSDPEVLLGSLELLMETPFESVAGVDLVEKLIRTTALDSDVASRLFQSYRLHRHRGSEKQSEVLVEVASRLVQNSDRVRFAVVKAAASYLSMYAPITFPPLVADEARLGIRCSVHG